MQSDELLMLQFQQGAREAFAELFARYRDRLYGFFRRRLNDPGRAEELAQEVFLAVLRRSAQYEPRALFRTYLYAIAVRMLVAERRKARVVQTADPPTDTSGGPAQDSELIIRDALAQLDSEHREVVMLREYEQLSYAEIPDTLGIPVNTVRSRLFRARMALKDLLAPAPQASGEKP